MNNSTRWIRRFFVFFGCLVLTSGLWAQAVGDKAPAQSGASSQAPNPSGTQPHDNSFVIGNDDVLLINVWKEQEISKSVPVRSDGKISLPLVGEVQAAGQTPLKLEQAIADKLKNYISDPEVTVIVQQINSQKFNILGQVTKPGSYPLTNSPTVLDAIAIAGGFRDFAKKKSIYVLRQNADGTQTRLAVQLQRRCQGQESAAEREAAAARHDRRTVIMNLADPMRVHVVIPRLAMLGLSVVIAARTAWSQTESNTSQQPVPAMIGVNNSATPADTYTPDTSGDRMTTPPPVSGQTYPIAATSEERANYLRGGLSFTGAYTDNAVGSVNGHPISDISYSVAPMIALDETTPTAALSLDLCTGFTFYQRVSALNSQDQNASIEFEYRLSPHVTFSARDGFQKTSNVFNQPPDLAL